MQKNIYFLLFILFVCLLSTASCTGQAEELPTEKPENLGGTFKIESECEYNEFPGTAVVFSVNWTTETSVQLSFNFIPETEAQEKEYRFTNFRNENQTKIIYFKTAPDEKIRKIIMEQNIIECIRMEIKKGTCTPVVFKFPLLEE